MLNRTLTSFIFILLICSPLRGDDDALAELVDLIDIMKDVQDFADSGTLREILSDSLNEEVKEQIIEPLGSAIKMGEFYLEVRPITDGESVWIAYFEDNFRDNFLAERSRGTMAEVYSLFTITLDSLFSKNDSWTETERHVVDVLADIWNRIHNYYIDFVHDPKFLEEYTRDLDLFHEIRVETLIDVLQGFTIARHCAEAFEKEIHKKHDRFPWLYREMYSEQSARLAEILKDLTLSEDKEDVAVENINEFLLAQGDETIMRYFREVPFLIIEGVTNEDKEIAKEFFECTRRFTRPSNPYFEFDYYRWVFNFDGSGN